MQDQVVQEKKKAGSNNAYLSLSKTSRRFFEFVQSHPEGFKRSSYGPLYAKDDLIKYELQSWPTFVTRQWVKEMERISVGLCRLIKQVPEAFFDNDPKRLREFFDLNDDESAVVSELLTQTPLLEAAVGRGDLVYTDDGFKCVEMNMAAGVGGWEAILWASKYLTAPLIAQFLDKHKVKVSFRDTLSFFLRHILRQAHADDLCPEGELNVAVLINWTESEAKGVAIINEFLRQRYGAFLEGEAKGLQGKMYICRYDDLQEKDGLVFHGERRIHIGIRQSEVEIAAGVLDSVIQRKFHYYQPLFELLGDKRLLALISKGAESRRLEPKDRKLIEAHLPWTRLVAPRRERWQQQEVFLPDFLISEQRNLVLKPGIGGGGRGVCIGRDASGQEWSDAVKKAMDAKDTWVVQEFTESRTFYYQFGEEGIHPCGMVWGPFIFGDVYAGCFVRMMPKEKGSVLNTAQGARAGIVFEVEE